MNIPIYRAKRIDRDGYVEGFLIKSYDTYYIVNDRASKICDSEGGTILGYDISEEYSDAFEIDPTTLAIYHEGMLDAQGNKIFASLQEDGKGGDILIEDGKYEDGFNPTFEPYFRKSSFSIFDLPITPYGQSKLHKYKVIRIQQ